ncbi:MAG: glycosyltransferase [Phycisphaerales bacterium]
MSEVIHEPVWPRAQRPMRVVVLGWARLALQAAEGTGYNLNASELAAGLALMGHSVAYLSSGMAYSATPGIRVRHREDWRGVRCFEVVNSPNLSPAAANFRNMQSEVACPALTRAVIAFLDRMDSEVVHAHSLEGFSLDLPIAIKATGRALVITPHNYWFACPQVDLLHRERALCTDYEGGLRCEGCLSADPPRVKRLKRIAGRAGERVLGPKQTELIKAKSKRLLRGINGESEAEPPGRVERNPLPTAEVAAGHRVDEADTGLIEHAFAEHAVNEPEPPVPLHADENERFIATPEVHLRVINGYGRRRIAGIEAMRAADLITPPSEFNRDLHAAMGVPREKIRVVRYGQPHFDQINRRTRRSPFYRTPPWDPARAARPLRFGFFGTTRPNKGLEVLVRAIPMLDRDIRQRCQFIIRAQGQDWPFRKRMAAYPEVNFLGGYDLLQLIGAGGEYDIGILPHVWFDNSPLVMWEHLHAGKMVIAARLGGAADTIRSLDDGDAGNGLFFAGGRPDDLARQITRVVTGEVAVPSAAEVHSASTLTSYPEHVLEVEGIYQELQAWR